MRALGASLGFAMVLSFGGNTVSSGPVVSNPTVIIQQNGLTATQSVYTTGSATVPAGKLILGVVFGVIAAGPHTNPAVITGNGMTWQPVIPGLVDPGANKWLGFYYGVSTGATGTFTITWSENQTACCWGFMSVDNADITSNGANAIAQCRWTRRQDPTEIATQAEMFGFTSISPSTNMNAIVGMRNDDGDAHTNIYPSGYNEIIGGHRVDTNPMLYMATRQGESIQPVLSWSGIVGSTGGGCHYFIALVEIRAASSAANRTFLEKPTITPIYSGSITTDAASFGFGSNLFATPAANTLMLIACLNSKGTGPAVSPATVNAAGASFAEINTGQDFASLYHLSFWRGMAAVPTNAKVQTAFGGVTQTGCAVVMVSVAGANTGGSAGSAAIVQSAKNSAVSTTTTVTLGAGAGVNNPVFTCFAVDVNIDPSAAGGTVYPQFTPSPGNAYIDKAGYKAGTGIAGPPQGAASCVGYATPNGGLGIMWRNDFATANGVTVPGAGNIAALSAEVTA